MILNYTSSAPICREMAFLVFKKWVFVFHLFLFFSTLHFGDNDTIGAIAGNWFGALRGFTDIKNKNFYIDQLKIWVAEIFFWT